MDSIEAVCGILYTASYMHTKLPAIMAYSLTTAVQAYHVCKAFWMANLGEVLPCKREESNPQDPFAVAVYGGRNIVGHVPKKFSAVCALFLR